MAKKKAAKSALIYLVLDKSGSMEPIRQATIEGVGRFVNETKEANPDALFSLLLFDTEITKVYTNKRIADIEPIDGSIYRPAGGTALLDALGHAMSDIEALADKPEKVAIVVMTDGAENSSREFTRAAVRAATERHEQEDNWQFVYLGANVDEFAEAGAVGIARAASASSWSPTYAGTVAMASMASTATNAYVSGISPSAEVDADEYAANFNLVNSGEIQNQTLDERLRAYKARRGSSSPSK